MMQAIWLTANNAYVVTFGDSPIRLQNKGGPWPMFFSTRTALDEALRACGLQRKGLKITVERD